MLRQSKKKRTFKHNLMLASSTAFVAGVVDVVGVTLFFNFTTNVTGHVAKLAKNAAEHNYGSMKSITVWLFMFLSGAFAANFIMKSLKQTSAYFAHAIPIVIEVIILTTVAVYGTYFYQNAAPEKTLLISALLFSMGLQNSLVSNVSGGLVKSTHLTGLFTDLGSELAELTHPSTTKYAEILKKITLRITILMLFLLGGFSGRYFFDMYKFKLFYFVAFILIIILYYDPVTTIWRRTIRYFKHSGRLLQV